MSLRVSFVSLVVVLCVLAACSVDGVPLANTRCPCTSGYRCCLAEQRCVPEDQMCSPAEEADEDNLVWGPIMGFGACAGSIDVFNDATIDATWKTTRSENSIEKLIDYGPDGTPDLRVFAQFDDQDPPHPIRWTVEDLGKGLTSLSMDWTYLPSGQRSTYTFTKFDNADVPYAVESFRMEFRYLPDRVLADYDVNFDGVDAQSVIFQDEDGQNVRTELDAAELSGGHLDGVFDELRLETYENGRRIDHREYRQGIATKVLTYEYDDARRMVIVNEDVEADGVPDRGLVKTLDEQGRATRREYWGAPMTFETMTLAYDYDCSVP